MPKIIENIRERLLEEAKKQVMELGYSSMTIRSVAGACGVGVGTVYNYFSSKDMLIAGFMLTDWQTSMEKLGAVSAGSDKPQEILECVYRELRTFIEKYRTLFQDKRADQSFAAVFPQRHQQLRGQIAEHFGKLCRRQKRVDPVFLAEFIAENMLTWTMEGRSYEEISGILLQLM